MPNTKPTGNSLATLVAISSIGHVLRLSLAVSLAALLTSSAALAQHRRFELDWRAPAGCPDSSKLELEVEVEVEELIADSAAAPQVPIVVAEGKVTGNSSGFALTLVFGGAKAARTRHISAPNCEELAHAAALIVAIAVDPKILERRVANSESHDSAGESRDSTKERLVPTIGTPASAREPLTSKAMTLAVPGGREQDAQSVAMTPTTPIPSTTPSARRHPHLDVPAPLPTNSGSLQASALSWRFGLGTFVSLGVLPGTQLGTSLLGAIQGKRARFELVMTGLTATVRSDSVAGRGAGLSLYRAR